MELSIYDFILVRNSNIWPNWAPLEIHVLQNLFHLEFDLSWGLKVKSNSADGLPIHGFLLVFKTIRMSISGRLTVRHL